MKIAEALIQIKDMKGKLAVISRQIQMNHSFQQIDESVPMESTDPLIQDYVDVSNSLASMKSRITKTNSKNGLCDKIYEMESLRSVIATFEQYANVKQKSASFLGYGDESKSVITHATFNVEELNARLDVARKRIRDLDLELQKSNWVVDLEE